jgi:hypothetical protein
MKKLFTFIILISLSAVVFGQAPKVEDRVAALEKQVKSLQEEATSMHSEISTLKDRYAHYQRQLNLRQVTKVTVDSIDYGILSAVGNKATGELTITLSAVNKGFTDRDIQLSDLELNDFDGNIFSVDAYQSDQYIRIGNKNNGSRATVRTNIPVKIFITFKNIPSGTRIANLHFEEIATFTTGKINFREIPVEWK